LLEVSVVAVTFAENVQHTGRLKVTVPSDQLPFGFLHLVFPQDASRAIQKCPENILKLSACLGDSGRFKSRLQRLISNSAVFLISTLGTAFYETPSSTIDVSGQGRGGEHVNRQSNKCVVNLCIEPLRHGYSQLSVTPASQCKCCILPNAFISIITRKLLSQAW
jgi:hypothetical protein